jgi:transposase
MAEHNRKGYLHQGYTGERAAKAAADHGIALEVVKVPEAKRGFVLLRRRSVVERAFLDGRFGRLARDYERLPPTLAGLHPVAFSVLLLRRAADFAAVRNSL